jgi:hypothetical protein
MKILAHILSCHPRVGGDPCLLIGLVCTNTMDSRLRGNDGLGSGNDGRISGNDGPCGGSDNQLGDFRES